MALAPAPASAKASVNPSAPPASPLLTAFNDTATGAALIGAGQKAEPLESFVTAAVNCSRPPLSATAAPLSSRPAARAGIFMVPRLGRTGGLACDRAPVPAELMATTVNV